MTSAGDKISMFGLFVSIIPRSFPLSPPRFLRYNSWFSFSLASVFLPTQAQLEMESDKRKFTDLDQDESGPPKKKVIGPSLPPAAQSVESKPSPVEESDSESDSDDDFGPSMPPPEGGSIDHEQISQPPPNRMAPKDEKTESQRDQWMLHPPEQSDWAKKIDPTQLRNRKFQTGKSAGSASSKAVDASWVETPEERIRRLGDAVMGVGQPSNSPNPPVKNNAGQSKSMEEKIKKFQVSHQARGRPGLQLVSLD